MTSSIANRQLTYQEVVKAMNLDVSEDTLTQAMRKRGLVRQMAFLKSPLAVGNTYVFSSSFLFRLFVYVSSVFLCHAAG